MSSEQGQLFPTSEDDESQRRLTREEVDSIAQHIGAAADSSRVERERRLAEQAALEQQPPGETEDVSPESAAGSEKRDTKGWSRVDSDQHRKGIIDIAKRQLARAEEKHQAELANKAQRQPEQEPHDSAERPR